MNTDKLVRWSRRSAIPPVFGETGLVAAGVVLGAAIAQMVQDAGWSWFDVTRIGIVVLCVGLFFSLMPKADLSDEPLPQPTPCLPLKVSQPAPGGFEFVRLTTPERPLVIISVPPGTPVRLAVAEAPAVVVPH